jgi:hypothetical protein
MQTVCGMHETHFKQSEMSEIKNHDSGFCKICNKAHKLAQDEHFLPNTIAETLLFEEIDELDFGEEYTNALNNLKEVQSAMDVHDKTVKQVNLLISDYFEVKRREVDLMREQLLDRIHKCSEGLFDEINLYEEECRANMANLLNKQSASDVFNLNEVREELDFKQESINKLRYDPGLYKEINSKHCDDLEKIVNCTGAFLDLRTSLFLYLQSIRKFKKANVCFFF